MDQPSAFDRKHIKGSAEIQPPGLLEEFNLPPEVCDYIRKNQRMIWIVIGCVALVVVVGALYREYADYRAEKAASALSLAMKEEGSKKKDDLAKVAEDFGSTSSGMWARIELAHQAASNGEFAKAIQEFNDVKNEISAKDPLMPLVLSALAVYYEQDKKLEKAHETYQELSGYKGFEATSYEAMGRIFEQEGKKDKALEMYRKFIGSGAAKGEPSPNTDTDREIIEAKIKSLQE